MIKGFIFDLDGVITDTAEYHYIAWKMLADQEGLEFDRDVNEKLRGVSRMDSIRIIFEHNQKEVSEETAIELATQKNNYYVESLNQISEKDYLKGAKEILESLQKQNYKIALGSASKNAKNVLSRLKAIHFFDVIGDGNCVERSKPAPDIFLYAAKEMELSPSECVVFEDAESGVDAAIAGGFSCVGIGPSSRVGHATLNFPTMADVELEKVIDTCSKIEA